jgi:hypothetical protein
MATRKIATATATAAPVQARAAVAAEPKRPKPRLLQEDVPSYSLDQALRVARAIADNYGFRPTKPVNVAGAMGMTHTAGPFRAITGASVAYGITTGAAQGAEIGITPLGMRILRPTTVGDDVAAKREALLRPKVVGEFLRSYDGAALPPEAIAKNVLEQKGVPTDRLDGVLELIVEGARTVGFVREWGNGRRTVDLAGPIPTEEPGEAAGAAVAAAPPATPPAPVKVAAPAVTVGAGVHVNIEIHIAADASSETIEDIFRNMRRYVLNDGQADDGQTETE